jgi:hypothetical protein
LPGGKGEPGVPGALGLQGPPGSAGAPVSQKLNLQSKGKILNLFF